MHMPDDLSEPERRLVAGARREVPVDFRTDADDGPHEVARSGEERRVRAEVIAGITRQLVRP